MSKEYTVDYFIKKFSAIPANKWITRRFKASFGRACALGHCGFSETTDSHEAHALMKIVKSGIPGRTVTSINDRSWGTFQQKTPKARILAALRYIKKVTAC